MTRALVPVTLVTLFVVGVQLAVFSTLRFAGVVVMLVWLWPFAVGLAGFTVARASWRRVVGGRLLRHARRRRPSGSPRWSGSSLAYGASRLGKEGVGDLDSAAWWVTPALAAAAGSVAPLLYVALGGFAP